MSRSIVYYQISWPTTGLSYGTEFRAIWKMAMVQGEIVVVIQADP